MTTLIRNATVIAMDEAHGAEPFGSDLLIEAGHITAMGQCLAVPPGAAVIEASRRLVIPGLVNAHSHSAEMFFRGRYEKLPLELWLLYAYPLLRGPPLPKRMVYLRSMLMAIESLKGGVTMLVDHFFDPPVHDLERLGAAVQAYDDIGIRATVSSAVMDIHPLDALPFGREEVSPALQETLRFPPPITAAAYIDYCRAAADAFHGRQGRISFMVAPSAPQRCTAELMQACRDFARSRSIPFHSHVLETKTQAVTGHMLHGKSLVAYMDELGLLAPGTTIAHGVWVDAQDIDRLGAAGCSVVHNAIANLKLGSGLAPVRRLMDAGVNVALGSDGACSNDTVRMFDVMRVAALLHSATGPNHDDWLSSAEVLFMATRNGARSAGLGGITGSLETGKAADLLILNLDGLAFTPQNRLANHLVYAENGAAIETVMVAGEAVCARGLLTRIDEAGILAEIRAEMPAYLESHAKIEEANHIFHGAFAAVHRRATAMPLAFDRYLA